MPRPCRADYVCLLAIWIASYVAFGDDPEPPFSMTGEPNPRFTEIDAWAKTFMTEKKIAGGSVAIGCDGEVVFARGYGFADRDAQTPVEPTSLFRIASVSKPITAVAVVQLVEQGKLRLDESIVDLLDLTDGSRITDFDPWWSRVTLAHLLTHTGGWDRNRSGDPMFMDREIAGSFNTALPVTHSQVIGFQFLRGIDYAPGERFAYSNFGYCLLGRAIERASGQRYENYVREHLFSPLGITCARIGGTTADERLPGEVRYYTIDDYRSLAVVGPDAGRAEVPGQYGGWNQPLLDSHGGWVMSSVDLVRFGMALDAIEGEPRTRSGLLSATSAKAMFTAQAPYRVGQAIPPGYGYGWDVTRLDDTPLVEHGGALPCTAAILARLDNRIWFAALFNCGRTADGKWLQSGLDVALGRRILEAMRVAMRVNDQAPLRRPPPRQGGVAND
jgi:N-acyl-D-amino-acid deacylase